ncbi:MAG TPA: AMP-binding protein, partial [Steroidobacteraceae bacterium]
LDPTLFLAPPIFYESAWSMARLAGQTRPVTHAAVPATEQLEQASVAGLRAIFGRRMRKMYSGMAPIAPSILEGYQLAGLPIFEAYGMTEYGPIAANGPGANALGSVGRPLTPDTVRLAEDGEIIVRSPYPLTSGYLGEPAEEERQVYLDEMTIATGDIGHFDADGYLHIQGRKKQIIITSQGYKVHPETIERAFYQLPSVLHAVIMGERRQELGLLVMVENLDQSVQDAITAQVAELNAGICQHYPIRKVCIRSERFTPANGMLTENMKLHRMNIAARYDGEVFNPPPSSTI